MSFKEKTSEDFLKATLSNFKINSGARFIKILSRKIPTKLLNQLIIKENKKSYLQKYKTKELIALIIRLAKKDLDKKECIIVIDIVTILSCRYKNFQSISKNHPKPTSPEIIDDVLFPSKSITSVAGTNIFTIVNWKQLNIEIHDKEPENILFKKIINGIPSNYKIIEKNLVDMHLGLTTRKILRAFGYLDLEEPYSHPLNKKDQVFRLNKSLKELFKIPGPDNPFFWKKKELFTNITITAYDKNNTPVLPLK